MLLMVQPVQILTILKLRALFHLTLKIQRETLIMLPRYKKLSRHMLMSKQRMHKKRWKRPRKLVPKHLRRVKKRKLRLQNPSKNLISFLKHQIKC